MRCKTPFGGLNWKLIAETAIKLHVKPLHQEFFEILLVQGFWRNLHIYVDKWLSKYLHGKRANYNSPKSVLHNLYMDFWDFLHCKVLPLFCSRSFWGCCSYFAGIICKTDLIFSRHLATGRRLSSEQVRVKTVWLMGWAKMLWGGQMLEFYQPDLSLLLQKCIYMHILHHLAPLSHVFAYIQFQLWWNSLAG